MALALLGCNTERNNPLDPALPLPAMYRLGSVDVTLSSGRSIEFAWIDSGTFTMGATPDLEALLRDSGLWLDHLHEDTKPSHEVHISEGFYLGRFEVTQAQWIEIMGEMPSGGTQQATADSSHPVVNVMWSDAVSLAETLSNMDGGAQYRLPTEAEWEYACRAGSQSIWFFGNDMSSLGNYAIYFANHFQYGGRYGAVGQKAPNAYGLYDMHGNVAEWVSDYYGPYAGASQTDPQGPTSGEMRVSRGGGWNNDPNLVFSAKRSSDPPDVMSTNKTVRLVRVE